ncbi:MAG: hypothetical protein Q7S04_02055 [Candidatus Moranbacteria bacterium]|nr:hypothetical protein [Candidatus Moranbacteria bacterium]
MEKLYAIFTAIIIGFSPYVSFAGGGGMDSCNIQLNTGWNLVGSTAGTASVASLFSDKTKVSTVWKWLTPKNTWAFYTPANTDGGVAYAMGKGYEFLTSIAGGEGFWVNALLPGTINICADLSVPPVAPPVATLETVISISTATGMVEITPVMAGGKVTNLAGSIPVEQVLDTNNQVIPGYRIAWNDNGDWYPAGGKVTALQLPKTSIVGGAKPVGVGAGMPYLVRPDGTFVPFNTDSFHTMFAVNGVPIPINADGQVHY